MKKRCLVVDDEPIAQQILEKHIQRIEALELVGICNNALEALNALHKETIDLMFLDIKMPSLSGLEMLKSLQNPPKVILTTAFSEFGAESYEYGVVDYLLKPISFERFLKAVNKILMSQQSDLASAGRSQDASPVSDFMFFKADKKIHKFYFKDILYIEGSGNYVKIHTEHSKPLMVLDKLGDLLQKLPQSQFCRVHKSFIINVEKILQIEGNRVKFSEVEIPISSTYKQEFERYILDRK